MDSPARFARTLALLALAAVAGCAGAGRSPVGDTDQGVSVDGGGGCTSNKDCAGTFKCDVKTGQCHQCIGDSDCSIGFVCNAHQCTRGCSPTQPCGDAGICINNTCLDCNTDADCTSPQNPRCDPDTHRCGPCYPTKDNCGLRTYCKKEGITWVCVDGCKDDQDCDSGPPDGGAPDAGMGGGKRCEMNKCIDCKQDSDCGAGKICKAGACINGCTMAQPCPMGLECCNGACSDLQTDNANCGVCGKGCQGGWNCCDAKCSNPQSDVTNCGMCGTLCTVDNGIPGCVLRQCVIAMCNPGWKDCNGQKMDGCETNTDSNINNCGGCNNPCALPQAAPKCVNGMCDVAGCNFGFGDCDGNPKNGCETNTVLDANNCGGCGMKCMLPHVQQQKCKIDCVVGLCEPGFIDCNNNPADGCEVDIANDPKNCGACGKQCPAVNGMAGCQAQQCTTKCNANYADCNNNQADGCEVNTQTDKNHCGGCGKVCNNTANVASTVCDAGKCDIDKCNAGFFDLIGGYPDGCECKAEGESAVCNPPTSLGVLAVGNSRTATGNLVPMGNENWYQVNFQSNTSKSYHPKVALTTNPGNAFRIELYVACGGNLLPCGNGGSASARTSWEVYYTGGDPASAFNPIPAVGNGGTVYIRVYRAMGGAVTCDNFVLTVSN